MVLEILCPQGILTLMHLWPWEWGQGHQNRLTCKEPLIYSTLKIWTDFIHRYWRYCTNKMQSSSSSIDLENKVKVTKIGWHLQTISSKYPCKSHWILAKGSWNIGSTSVLKVMQIFLISYSDLENKIKVTKIDWCREITLGKTLYESKRDAVNHSGDIAQTRYFDLNAAVTLKMRSRSPKSTGV